MNLLKSVKTPTLIACVTAAIIGLLLLIWPIFILQFICIILAIGLIAIGAMRIMTYFKEKKVHAAGSESGAGPVPDPGRYRDDRREQPADHHPAISSVHGRLVRRFPDAAAYIGSVPRPCR